MAEEHEVWSAVNRALTVPPLVPSRWLQLVAGSIQPEAGSVELQL